LQEGVSSEASSLAGHHKLGKLIVLYDDNNITIDGSTNLSFTEDVAMRYRAYGWHVLEVADGDNNVAGIEAAVKEAKSVLDQPTLIKITTTIGYGSAKQGTAGVHGAPLGNDDLGNVKQRFGFKPSESFVVEGDVREHFKSCVEQGAAAEASWQKMYDSYKVSLAMYHHLSRTVKTVICTTACVPTYARFAVDRDTIMSLTQSIILYVSILLCYRHTGRLPEACK
jgi:transketolase